MTSRPSPAQSIADTASLLSITRSTSLDQPATTVFHDNQTSYSSTDSTPNFHSTDSNVTNGALPSGGASAAKAEERPVEGWAPKESEGITGAGATDASGAGSGGIAGDVGQEGAVQGKGGEGEDMGEDGYPVQRHAGKVGYGPNYHQGPTFGDKLEGAKEVIKGKITRNHDLAETGKDRILGELQEKEKAKDDAEDPFAKDKEAQAKEDATKATQEGQSDTTAAEKRGAATAGNPDI
ncbi:Calmodulin-like protein [Pseudohyphozyma bogoriensis]|nr:Calmodulin-like protein [Pseudohyphozyma bogoriensis]